MGLECLSGRTVTWSCFFFFLYIYMCRKVMNRQEKLIAYTKDMSPSKLNYKPAARNMPPNSDH